MKIRPLQDRILVKRVDEEGRRPRGASSSPIPPRRSRRKAWSWPWDPARPSRAATIAKPGVKKGDRILFSKYAGTDVNVDGDEHIIIREDDVLAIWE